MARMGGLARAKAYSKAELRKWGERGGRPAKLDQKSILKLSGCSRRPQSGGVREGSWRIDSHHRASDGSEAKAGSCLTLWFDASLFSGFAVEQPLHGLVEFTLVFEGL